MNFTPTLTHGARIIRDADATGKMHRYALHAS